jgi:NADP-dependent 3-hydroxy acid dehydrogenase YdfG
MNDLDGKDCPGDGAGSGIGEAAALALAGEGAPILLTRRRQAPLEAVAARITSAAAKLSRGRAYIGAMTQREQTTHDGPQKS